MVYIRTNLKNLGNYQTYHLDILLKVTKHDLKNGKWCLKVEFLCDFVGFGCKAISKWEEGVIMRITLFYSRGAKKYFRGAKTRFFTLFYSLLLFFVLVYVLLVTSSDMGFPFFKFLLVVHWTMYECSSLLNVSLSKKKNEGLYFTQ